MYKKWLPEMGHRSGLKLTEWYLGHDTELRDYTVPGTTGAGMKFGMNLG